MLIWAVHSTASTFGTLHTMTEILIDTNVFLYDLDRSSVHHSAASSILSSGHPLRTTSKNIAEFFAVTSKFKVDTLTVWNYYQEIKQNTRILFPSSQSLTILEQLIKTYQPVGNRVFDMEIVSIALSHHVKTIATFNRKDFTQIREITLL